MYSTIKYVDKVSLTRSYSDEDSEDSDGSAELIQNPDKKDD